MNYTERVDGFQIRDAVYLVTPPRHSAPQYDIVKWWKEPNPHLGTVCAYKNGRLETCEGIVTEYCYSVGTLTWNPTRETFEFASVDLRWLQENPGEEVIQMIMDFAAERAKKYIAARRNR